MSNGAYCLQGNGIDRSDKAGCNGKGWTEDVSYTLNTMDRHAISAPLAEVASALRAGAGAPKHESDIKGRLALQTVYAVAIENHPNDSRVKLRDNNIVQTLSGRMGTGGAARS